MVRYVTPCLLASTSRYFEEWYYLRLQGQKIQDNRANKTGPHQELNLQQRLCKNLKPSRVAIFGHACFCKFSNSFQAVYLVLVKDSNAY